MKNAFIIGAMLMTTAALGAAPLRVAVLDFEDQTGLKSDAQLGGSIAPGALAEKGVYLLGKKLVGNDKFVLIDRRDFINQMEQMRLQDGSQISAALPIREEGKATPTRPTFIHAAQALRADAVLRGSLLSFSTGKQVVDQGGYKTEFSKVSLRVAIEALDSVDGSVIAMADGSASSSIRQTSETYTELSEDDVLGLFDKAVSEAVPKLETALTERTARLEAQPKIKLSVKTDADPAMIEIDGILVGTSPVADLEVYKGDHVLAVGKPGYQDVTKRILFEKNTSIEVPMIRKDLTADELKQVLDKMRLHMFSGAEPALIINEETTTAP